MFVKIYVCVDGFKYKQPKGDLMSQFFDLALYKVILLAVMLPSELVSYLVTHMQFVHFLFISMCR